MASFLHVVYAAIIGFELMVLNSLQTVTCGVPQSSLLGPLLHLCYSNDMELSVENKLLLYADDSVFIANDKDPTVVSDMLSTDLQPCNQ